MKFTETVGEIAQSYECDTIEELVALRTAIKKSDEPQTGESKAVVEPAAEEGANT